MNTLSGILVTVRVTTAAGNLSVSASVCPAIDLVVDLAGIAHRKPNQQATTAITIGVITTNQPTTE